MRFKLLFLALPCCLTAFSSLAMSPAGKTMIAKGSVQAYEDAANMRKLKRRAPIFDVDTVQTDDNSKAQFRMNDGTLLALKENSKLLIAEYNYNAEEGGGSAVLELVEGGLRSVTGAIKSNNGSYELKTPVGSIGIRGTHYEIELIQGEVFIAVWDGAIDVSVDVGGTDQTVSFGEGEDFSYGIIDESGEVTELLEPPANFDAGHSDDASSDDEEQSENSQQSSEEEEQSDNSQQSNDDEEQSDNSQQSSDDEEQSDNSQQSDDDEEQSDNSQQSSENSSESDGDENSSDDNTGSNDSGNGGADNSNEDANSSGSTGNDNTSETNSTDSNSTSSQGDTNLSSGGGTESSPPGGTAGPGSTTPPDSGSGSSSEPAVETGGLDTSTGTAPTIDIDTNTSGTPLTEVETPFDEANEQRRDNDVIQVIDNNTKVNPEIIAARTGSANFSTLISSSLSGDRNPANLNINMAVNFDTNLTTGDLSLTDTGGTWDAAFQGLIEGADLDLRVTDATYGNVNEPNSVQPADGSISAFFANEGDVINGNFNLSQGGIDVNGSFLLREN